MQQLGADVEVLSSPGEGLDEFLQNTPVVSHTIAMPRRITPTADLLALFRIWLLLRRGEYHIVHAHTPKAGLLVMVAAWLARVPVRIYHIHGLPFATQSGLRRRLLFWSERLACRASSQVLCVSRSIRDVAVAHGICSPSRICVLAGGSISGVSLDRFDPEQHLPQEREAIRAELGLPSSAVVAGFVGRLVRDKGMREFMQAWEKLREAVPSLYLLLVGPFEEGDALPASLRSYMLSDTRIRCTGLRWDTPRLYSAMDMLVLPSYREGFPVAPLEAAAMRLPIVATRIPGCTDAVVDGVTGTLVAPKNVPELERAIAQYACTPELRRKHGEAGRARVEREFSEQIVLDATFVEYQRLIRTLVGQNV